MNHVSEIEKHIGQATFGDYGNGNPLPQRTAFVATDPDMNPVDSVFSQVFRGRIAHLTRSTTNQKAMFRPGAINGQVPYTIYGGAGAENDVHNNVRPLALSQRPGDGIYPITQNDDVVNYNLHSAKILGLTHAGGYQFYSTEGNFDLNNPVYRNGDFLHSPTISQLTLPGDPAGDAVVKQQAGKIFNTRAWAGGGNGAITPYEDHICGSVVVNDDEIFEYMTPRNIYSTHPDGSQVAAVNRTGHDQYNNRVIHYINMFLPGVGEAAGSYDT